MARWSDGPMIRRRCDATVTVTVVRHDPIRWSADPMARWSDVRWFPMVRGRWRWLWLVSSKSGPSPSQVKSRVKSQVKSSQVTSHKSQVQAAELLRAEAEAEAWGRPGRGRGQGQGRGAGLRPEARGWACWPDPMVRWRSDGPADPVRWSDGPWPWPWPDDPMTTWFMIRLIRWPMIVTQWSDSDPMVRWLRLPNLGRLCSSVGNYLFTSHGSKNRIQNAPWEPVPTWERSPGTLWKNRKLASITTS